MSTRAVFESVRRALLRLWSTKMGKATAVLLVLGVWRRWFLVVPAVYYGIRLLRFGMRRLLYSVRAKLAAFYLYAALLPILLVAVVLLFVGYVVLGQVSARAVQARLERHVVWLEQRADIAERTYWQARAAGADAGRALEEALALAYDGVDFDRWSSWGVDAAGSLRAARGRPPEPVPEWLGERRFVGLALGDSARLELRTRLRLLDAGGPVEIGSRLILSTPLLNSGLGGHLDEVRGVLGKPDRPVQDEARAMEALVEEEGIFAYLNPRRVTVGTSGVTLHVSSDTDAQSTAADTAAAPAIPGIRSRYRLLDWLYIGYPVDWSTGRTQATGPPILVKFSVEGATRALLRTGVGVGPPILVGVAAVVGFLMVLQVVASLMGFAYARAISKSVAKLDRGVRAVRAGDFGHRIQPLQRDQLGTLALTFNDMSQRLQELLEQRAAHQAMEHELAIAREVQARLFPEKSPYAPFLEASGVCVPARTVSGDYYDFIELGTGYDAVIADVSGKGMSAALLMASLHSALRSLYLRDPGQEQPGTGEILTRLNTHLHSYIEPTRFVTLFLARYMGRGLLEYCNAGHNPAALLRGGRLEWLSSGGTILGPFADLEYDAAEVAVRPGDVVCMYTDGVTEAMSLEGEHFGESRLADLLQDASDKSPRDIVATVQDSVRRWRGEADTSDDVTLVVLRVSG